MNRLSPLIVKMAECKEDETNLHNIYHLETVTFVEAIFDGGLLVGHVPVLNVIIVSGHSVPTAATTLVVGLVVELHDKLGGCRKPSSIQ